MTNLPIINTPPKSPGSAAHVALTGNVADSQPAEGLPRSDGALADASATFAALLARQLGGAELAAANIAPDATAAPHSMDKQEEAAIPAGAPGEQANTLAAMLLQLPLPEDRGQRTEGIGQKAEDGQTAQPAVIGSLRQTAGESPGTDSLLPAADNRQPADSPALNPLPPDAANRAELTAGPTQPTTAQAVASPAIFSVMPNALTNNKPANTPQAIATPLGDSGWAGDFSQKISWMSTQKNQVAELHLNPPDLGPLNVVLKISDNQATALFTSPHGAVREAVENAIPRLRETLADNGITLGNTTVSDQAPRDRDTERFMNRDSGTATRGDVSGEANLLPASSHVAPARRHNGMVDTFA